MPDSHLSARHAVIGTAGHIDHGKTALIRALTGIDTDRLAEEKRRGISIDLGFAFLTLPDETQISFIDVPGHERFIKNMLAGVGGIEAVLLVVAADESVKPQTREHFEICRLLGIEHGLVVLTKIDLASENQLSQACAAVRVLCAGSFLEQAPIIPVSAVTGQGIGELKAALKKLARSCVGRRHGDLARLPIDRSFVLKGFGTVVTGTLWGGVLQTGDTLEIHPGAIEVRIRGLQVHGRTVALVNAGQRAAVNLSGIDHSVIQRGSLLVAPKLFHTTNRLQAFVSWLPRLDLPSRREDLLLHTGTSEIVVCAALLATDSSGSLIHMELPEPALVLPGDRVILRRPSPSQTIGGGHIIDAFPPKRLDRLRTVRRLRRLLSGDLSTRLEVLVTEKQQGLALEALAGLTGSTATDLKAAVQSSPNLLLIANEQHVISKEWQAQRRQILLTWLSSFHSKHPSLPGAPLAEARLGLKPALAEAVLNGVVDIRITGNLVALSSHRIQVSEQETAALTRFEEAFRKAGCQPPGPFELAKLAGIPPHSERDLLEKLIKQERLIRLAPQLVFHRDALSHLRASLLRQKGRRFSVPQFKEWLRISRKYAIPILEYFDQQHVTKREGDMRLVL